jgi:hypothetical protein
MALCFKIVSTSATALISEGVADFGAWYSGVRDAVKRYIQQHNIPVLDRRGNGRR